jgi:ferredoxin-NADP reductase
VGNPIRLRATIEQVITHGTGVYQVRMRPEVHVPRFKPGQFLHLALDDFDPTAGFWPESRVFSIASSPEDELLEIVYSVKGRYTSRMAGEIAVGRHVWLKLPYGSFIIGRTRRDASALVLVAGGTGLSPFIPFIRGSISEVNRPMGSRIVLHYGVRSLDMVLYSGLLSEAARRLVGFTWRLWVEEGKGAAPAADMPVVPTRGRLDPDTVVREESSHSAAYYLSGPPAMIEHFQHRLRELSVLEEHIHIDEWE